MDIDLAALRALERERDVSLDILIPAIEQALLLAYHRTEGAYRNARVQLDRKTGHVVVWAREEIEQPEPEEGEEHPPREYGPEFDDTPTGFGRIAAATARQVIVQRLRDLEDDAIMGDFKGREGDVVAGVIQQSPDPRHVTVDFGTVEGILMSVAIMLAGGCWFISSPEVGRVRIPRSKRRFGTVLAVSFVYGFAVGIGVVFLIVPGIWLATTYFAAMAVAMVEGSNRAVSFDRSAALTQGSKWRIIGVFLVAYLVYFLITIVVAGIAVAVSGPLLGTLLTVLVMACTYPFIGTLTTLLYFDLRIRREGFDLDMMMETPAVGTVPAAG